jgi:transposase
MWTPEHRRAANRSGLRYPSDLTDDEWAIVAPMIPPARHGGRKRSVNVRGVLNGIFYVLWTGCQWKAMPKDLPPKSTVHDYLELWNWDGTLERIHHALYVAVREQEGREASPTTAIIDSQTAKGAQKGGLARSFGLRRGQEDQGVHQISAAGTWHPPPKKPPVRPPGTNTWLTVSGGPCINSRRPRERLRRSGHRAYSLCRCLRGADGGVDRHRGWPGFGIASRSPCRVDRIARRRLPCAKRASLLSCRHLRAERRLPTAQFRKDAPEEP